MRCFYFCSRYCEAVDFKRRLLVRTVIVQQSIKYLTRIRTNSILTVRFIITYNFRHSLNFVFVTPLSSCGMECNHILQRCFGVVVSGTVRYVNELVGIQNTRSHIRYRFALLYVALFQVIESKLSNNFCFLFPEAIKETIYCCRITEMHHTTIDGAVTTFSSPKPSLKQKIVLERELLAFLIPTILSLSKRIFEDDDIRVEEKHVFHRFQCLKYERMFQPSQVLISVFAILRKWKQLRKRLFYTVSNIFGSA
mmetsp:Transcript_32060/g.54070  ORF Transcript_32060/g.54070 Transcript_32060/m.54070 type:complete len:252 (-) Transcript_32060:365-1120(-)